VANVTFIFETSSNSKLKEMRGHGIKGVRKGGVGVETPLELDILQKTLL